MFKWRYLSLLSLAALSLNCFNEPLAPVVPTWDTNLTFPLGNLHTRRSDREEYESTFRRCE
jgi:hypothetical protein